jgi:NAD(P)-dependent dehydrogenase (short-subunit alcohol dehydrogenase family)
VGGYWAHGHVTADGLERTFALNHLAPFLLTNLLLDRLLASAPARIVTVSSGAQAMGRIDFNDLQGERGYSGQRAYNQSKLANVMFTYELIRRLAGTGVTVTVLHPGVARTAFGAEDQSAFFTVMSKAVRPFMKTPAQNVETPICLASSPEMEGVTGQYFANRKSRRSNKASYDPAATARLWQVSGALTGLAQDTGRQGPDPPLGCRIAGRIQPVVATPRSCGRVRWLLLVLGTLGILVPVAAVIALLASLDEIRFG